MTIRAVSDIIQSYFSEYEVSAHTAKSGSVYIGIRHVLVRVSDHKRKPAARPDFDVRVDWKKMIRRPVYSADFMRVILKEIKIALDKRN